MTPGQVAEVVRELEEASARARALFARGRGLAAPPRPGGWSAAGCVAHLTLTTEATLPRLEEAVGGLVARGARRSGPSRMDWMGRLLRWSQEPPSRLRTRTAPSFQPQAVEPLEAVLPAFLASQERLLALARRTEGLDLQAGRITSPFNQRVRYNPYAALRILAAHQRRHLGQAEEAVRGASARGE